VWAGDLSVFISGNGTLDFAEFLCLMYFWEESGDYSAFFRNPVNADAVQNSFKIMERAMIKYDVDKSGTLQLTELNQFFSDHFQAMFAAGTVKDIINAIHPNLLTNVSTLPFPLSLRMKSESRTCMRQLWSMKEGSDKYQREAFPRLDLPAAML